MTRQELINMAGSEEAAEKTIDAILASIKPAFVAMALKAADTSIKREVLHTYYIGYRIVDGTISHATVDAYSEVLARHDLNMLLGSTLGSIICAVDLGFAESFHNGGGPA